MEIVVHGNNDGYEKLYSTKEGIGYIVLNDIRKVARNDKQLGHSAFTLAFVENGYIISKYKVVKDALRNNTKGFIAFSLFFPSNRELDGGSIILLLNEISAIYSDKYISGNRMNRGEGQPINEDYSFVLEIMSKYSDHEKLFNEKKLSSTNNGKYAYIYYPFEYKDTDSNVCIANLEELLDAPFQDEYTNYEQIIFIDKKYEGTEECPLYNPIPEYNLTGKIDINNPIYTLNISPNAKVKVNGFSIQSCNKIRLKDDLEILFSKRYFKDKKVEGELRNIDPTYLNIDKVNKIVTIRDIQLEPITHRFTIETKDINGKPLSGVNLMVTNKDGEKKLTSSPIIRTEEQLKDQWYVEGKKGNMISEPVRISIGKESIMLTLIETRIVNYKVYRGTVGADLFLDNEFSIKVTDVKKPPNDGKITFVRKEIDKRHTITVTANGYETESFEYIPGKDHSNDIHLALIKIKSYNIDIGDHGVKTSLCPELSQHSKGGDIPSRAIKPQKGYVFTGWKLNGSKDTLMAQYKKKKILDSRLILIGIYIIGLCVIGFMGWKYIPKLFHRTEKISKPVRTPKLQQTNKNQSNNIPAVSSKNKDTTMSGNNDLKANNNAELTNSNTDKKPNEKTTGSTDIEFLRLVRSGNVQMNDYNSLLNKYKDQKSPVIGYLKEICKDSKSFKQFSNLPDSIRIRAKSVSDLKK